MLHNTLNERNLVQLQSSPSKSVNPNFNYRNLKSVMGLQMSLFTKREEGNWENVTDFKDDHSPPSLIYLFEMHPVHW